MPRDYYIILGVSRNAELSKIKKAYRKAVKRYHPDISGSVEDAERFLEIKEAYDTLRDEEKRRIYDEALAQEESPYRVSRVPDIIRRRTRWVHEMDEFTSAVDDFLSGFLPGFFDRGKRIEKDLYVDLVLSPREAAGGGLFPITVPVIESCPRCARTGWWADFFCPQCRGFGRIKASREFSLSVPPRVRHGTEMTISLEDIGLKKSYLHLTILIDSSLAQSEW